MRRFALVLLLAASGLLAACAGPADLGVYAEDCITAGAPCPAGNE